MTDAHDIETQTREYYRGRALEYDEWYHRRGEYSHGADDDSAWARELTEIEAFLAPLRDRLVFEVAAGTGWWTRRLAARNRVIASDYAPEMIEKARAADAVEQVVPRCRADAYRLPVAAQTFDACVFNFFLSHVPVPRAPEFVRQAARIVRSGGELWMADSRQDPRSGKRRQRVPGARVQRQERELNDGRKFAIWKIYWTPADLRFLLGLVCHDVEVRQTERFFILARGIVA